MPASRHVEDDPALKGRLEQVCALEDAKGLFEEIAGDAPRKMDGETPVVVGTGEIRILRVLLLDEAGVERQRFRTGEDLVVAVTIRTTEQVERPIFGVALFRDDGTYVYGPNTRFDGVLEANFNGVYTFFVHYPQLPLLAGSYRLSVAFFDRGHVRPHVWHNQLYSLEVVQESEGHGLEIGRAHV